MNYRIRGRRKKEILGCAGTKVKIDNLSFSSPASAFLPEDILAHVSVSPLHQNQSIPSPVKTHTLCPCLFFRSETSAYCWKDLALISWMDRKLHLSIIGSIWREPWTVQRDWNVLKFGLNPGPYSGMAMDRKLHIGIIGIIWREPWTFQRDWNVFN
jgi:hypothetical protein